MLRSARADTSVRSQSQCGLYLRRVLALVQRGRSLSLPVLPYEGVAQASVGFCPMFRLLRRCRRATRSFHHRSCRKRAIYRCRPRTKGWGAIHVSQKGAPAHARAASPHPPRPPAPWRSRPAARGGKDPSTRRSLCLAQRAARWDHPRRAKTPRYARRGRHPARACPAPAAAGEASPALVQTLSHCRPLPRQRTARGRYLHRHALSQLRAREAYGNFPSILKSMHTRFTAGKLGTRHGELAVRSHRACVSEGWDSCPLPDNDRTIMTALSLK
jgi:hypothetical protein